MIFTLDELQFDYPDKVGAALRDVSVGIPAGGTTALLGQSGAGKTTLLHLLALLRDSRKKSGEIRYRDPTSGTEHDYAHLAERTKERLRLTAFGVVLQTSYLLPHFDCVQNVAVPLALLGQTRRVREAAAEKLLERSEDAELYAARHNSGNDISVGQKQRVALLRSLVNDPAVVFADEPTSSLDDANTKRMFDLLGLWRAGKLVPDPVVPPEQRALVLVCHNVRTALDRSANVVVLHKGLVDRTFPTEKWSEHAGAVNALLGSNVPPEYVRTSSERVPI